MGKKTTNFLHGLIDFPKNVWSDVHDLPADIREHGWRSRIPPLPGRGFRRRRIQDWQNQTYPYRDWPHRRKRWDELYNYQDPAEPDAQAHQSAEMNGTILPSVEGPDGVRASSTAQGTATPEESSHGTHTSSRRSETVAASSRTRSSAASAAASPSMSTGRPSPARTTQVDGSGGGEAASRVSSVSGAAGGSRRVGRSRSHAPTHRR